MPTLDELLVKIDASTELLRRELKKGEGSVGKFERNVDRRLRKVDRRFARLGAGIRTAIGAFGVGVGIAGIASFSRSVASAGLELERYERALKFATGSQEGADREMQFLRETADRLGLDLRTLIASYSGLAAAAKGTNLEGMATRDIFLGISEAATVLGMTAEQTEGALRAIDQMISKGNVQAEELRGQLGERLPGAFQIAARAMGVTTEELNDMLDAGDVAASYLLPRLAQELHRTFGPEVATAADSAQAAINRWSTAIFDLKTSIASSGVLEALASLAEFGTRVSEGFRITFNPSDVERIHQINAEIQALRKQKEALGGVGFINLFGGSDQRIAELKAELDDIFERQKAAARAQAGILRDQPLEPITIDVKRREFSIMDAPSGFLSRLEEDVEVPAFVRAGSNLFPSRDEMDEVREQLMALEEQALQAQGRMAEAIRLAADQQIAEWQRVAEQTPEFADEAARAIELINERAAVEIEDALKKTSPAIEQFASQFAAAFESRGIDALLAGDISDALQGMAKDIAELILRLVILKPLAESLGGFLGGGLFGGGGGTTPLPVPSFAGGGRPPVGRPSVVGEDGMELFMPDVPGRIFNASQLKRMSEGGIVINQQNSTQAGLPPQWQAQMAMATKIAAVAAREAVAKELGGRR